MGIAATGARKLGEQLTKNDMKALARMIAARAPLYQNAPAVAAPVAAPLARGVMGGQLATPQMPGILGQLGLLPVRADDYQ